MPGSIFANHLVLPSGIKIELRHFFLSGKQKKAAAAMSSLGNSFPWRTSQQTSVYGSFVRQARWLAQLQRRPESRDQNRYDWITPSRSIDLRWACWHLKYTHTHTHTHTQEEGENRYEVVCSIYNHTVVLPVKHQGKSTLSYVHMLSLSLVRLFCDPMDWSPPGPPVHGISQIRTLEWFAISFSKGSSWPWDQTSVSCIDRRVLYQ